MDNLYSVLGVAQDAAQADIKKAFRALSKKYHPDVNPGDRGALEKFRRISEAYTLLQDPQKRKEYDEKLAQAQRRTPPRGKAPRQGTAQGGFCDVEGQFARFFGFRPSEKGSGKGSSGRADGSRA